MGGDARRVARLPLRAPIVGAMTQDSPQPYNPLGRIPLGESVVRALLERPCEPLPPGERFRGAGIYALYYTGDFAPYEPISSEDCEVPIYVGKAVPPGSRSGVGGTETRTGRQLYNRLNKHSASIDEATNLDLADFRFRHLVVEDIWIPLGESLLIRRFQPLWNSVVQGFGLNDPGSRRYGGDRSDWDQIHPGRSWRDRMVEHRSTDEILDDVRARLAEAAG